MYGLISDWRSSGLAQKVFCSQHKVPVSVLKYWIRKQKPGPSHTNGASVPRSAFIPIEVAPQALPLKSFPIKLHCPNGVVLEVCPLMPKGQLRALIQMY